MAAVDHQSTVVVIDKANLSELFHAAVSHTHLTLVSVPHAGYSAVLHHEDLRPRHQVREADLVPGRLWKPGSDSSLSNEIAALSQLQASKERSYRTASRVS